MAEPKPGVKTSEFALAALAMVVSALVAGGLFTDPEVCGWGWCGPVATVVGVAGTVLAAFGYGVNRTKLKAGDK